MRPACLLTLTFACVCGLALARSGDASHGPEAEGLGMATNAEPCLIAEAPCEKGRTMVYPTPVCWTTSGIPTSECQDSFDDRELRWSGRSGALFLYRDDPDSRTLITEFGTDTDLFNADTFQLGMEAGPEISVTRHFSNACEFEFRYFGIDAWNDFDTVSTTSGYRLAVASPNVLGVPIINADIDGTYLSDLHSCELNLRWRFDDCLSTSAGFRWVELDEQLTFVAEPFLVGERTYAFQTNNRLYGFQLGVDTVLMEIGRLAFDASFKGGIYSNRAGNHAFAERIVLPDLTTSEKRSHTAFLGELGVNATWHVTDRLSFLVGYRMLVVDGVALAPIQVGATDFDLGTGIDIGGTAFYQGLHVGLGWVR